MVLREVEMEQTDRAASTVNHTDVRVLRDDLGAISLTPDKGSVGSCRHLGARVHRAKPMIAYLSRGRSTRARSVLHVERFACFLVVL